MFFFVKYITRFFLYFTAKQVGSDDYGNSYYIHKSLCTSNGKKKRFCLYLDIPESSKVPQLWHAWLHYMTDEMPNCSSPKYLWYKKHLPNLSGTPFAYHYRISKKKGLHYTPWRPETEEK